MNKSAIQSALSVISPTCDFLERSKDLLSTLGYRSELTLELSGTVDEFFGEFPPITPNTKTEQEFRNNAESAHIVFQYTKDEIEDDPEQMTLLESQAFDKGNIKSFLFCAVELKDNTYSRTKYAEFTREINKRLFAPTVILFRAGNRLTVAFADRRPDKTDEDRDVLGQVTLIKDIRLNNPHRAHLDILSELSLAACVKWIDEKQKPKNFDGLLAAWLAKLDTEELNKQFYRKLFAWYEWAIEVATFPTDENRVIKAEEHVIRLITRLLFIWFIKEKGLVADALFNKAHIQDLLVENDFDNGDSYYRAVLQNLFFATLNTEIDERRFSKGNNSDHRNPSVYRYKKQMRDPDTLLKLFAKTPFINGGLFDCLDSFKATDAGGYRIDCFSDKQYHKLSIPNRLFFHPQQGLIPLLEHYKFTVEENTPIDQEVALDPELLGRVFENLLAAYNPETGATVRKQTGSYYTPRAIVDYMVEEALVATLSQKCNPTDGDAELWAERLHYLLDYAQAFDDANEWFDDIEMDAVVRAISELKILDPAVGSGAFPMGMLHKLTLALKRLDPDNTRWEKLQKERAIQRAEIAFDTQDDPTRREELIEIDETFKRYRDSDFGRKLYLIQNSIFGVDIKPVACQIAKLRFFISLAIEQQPDRAAENFGVKPLPNLETRFIAANTLIGLTAQRMLTSNTAQALERELGNNRERHFHATTRQRKRECQRRDEKLRAELATELESMGTAADDAEKIAQWDPYDQNATADWFDSEWMFGVPDGFDVVIGNPPYVDSENMTKTNLEGRRLLAKMYVTTKGNWDLYIPFWEISLKLIHEQGIATLITPNKWLSISYGKALRQYSKSFAYKFVDYSGFRVFESAGVFPIVVFMSNHPPNSIWVERYADNHNLISNQILPSEVTKKFENWGVFLSENLDLVVTIMEKSKKLSEYCDIEAAFTVSEAYKLSEYLSELSAAVSDTFKFINTGTIDPFISLWGTKKTTYLKQKYDRPVVDRELFRKHFEKRYIQTISPKIIISGIRHFEAFLDTNGEWIAGKSTVVLRNFSGIRPEMMLGILNSRIVSFFLKECYASLAMDGGINFSPANVSEIPIPDIQKSKDKCDEIMEIVNRIIIEKSDDIAKDTSDLENEIDKLVYALYGLTDDEIAIVEGSV